MRKIITEYIKESEVDSLLFNNSLVLDFNTSIEKPDTDINYVVIIKEVLTVDYTSKDIPKLISSGISFFVLRNKIVEIINSKNLDNIIFINTKDIYSLDNDTHNLALSVSSFIKTNFNKDINIKIILPEMDLNLKES